MLVIEGKTDHENEGQNNEGNIEYCQQAMTFFVFCQLEEEKVVVFFNKVIFRESQTSLGHFVHRFVINSGSFFSESQFAVEGLSHKLS